MSIFSQPAAANMTLTLIGLFSIFSYLGASALLFREILKTERHRYSSYCAWLAVMLHGAYIAQTLDPQHGFNFGFFNTASLVSALITLLLLIASLDKPLQKLGIAVFPLAAVLVTLDLALPAQPQSTTVFNWKMGTHILTSIAAFSLLNIAALQAVMLAIQDKQLKSHRPTRLIGSLPPLQAMEALLFQMIGTGLSFLTISLTSGFLFIEDLFAQHLVHKTVLSIIAWFIFSGLLFGRLKYGWRGQTAIRWTLTGFVLLLLAYFGSKLVLEIILQRH
ncbi:MAG: cytochrome c biogenesis protein CcsA [Methylomicrobium sp.]